MPDSQHRVGHSNGPAGCMGTWTPQRARGQSVRDRILDGLAVIRRLDVPICLICKGLSILDCMHGIINPPATGAYAHSGAGPASPSAATAPSENNAPTGTARSDVAFKQSVLSHRGDDCAVDAMWSARHLGVLGEKTAFPAASGTDLTSGVARNLSDMEDESAEGV